MAKIRGGVYAPPLGGVDLPDLAVILHGDEVLMAKPVPSVQAGETLIAKVLSDFAAMANAKRS